MCVCASFSWSKLSWGSHDLHSLDRQISSEGPVAKKIKNHNVQNKQQITKRVCVWLHVITLLGSILVRPRITSWSCPFLDDFFLVSAKMLSTWHLWAWCSPSPAACYQRTELIKIDQNWPYQMEVSDWKLHGASKGGNGSTCFGVKKSGTVMMALSSNWREAWSSYLPLKFDAQTTLGDLTTSHCGSISHSFAP